MIIVAIVAWIVVLGGGGAYLTRLDSWYYGLRKPSWQPPDWLFGPVWTGIFLLAGAAWWLAWRAGAGDPAGRLLVVAAYLVNGALNLFWSYLFFWRQRPDLAEREVGWLIASIVGLLAATGRLDTLAAWLVLPYLLWVCFATVLNRAVVRLNAPFAGR